MNRLFLDESAECSFSETSRYKHFLVTVVSLDPDDIKRLKTRMKRRIASWIKNGWPKEKEPKAFDIHKDRKLGAPAITRMLETLVTVPSLRVSYLVVNKKALKNKSFRSAPYGTAYNYFTGVLLSHLVFDDGLRDIHLIYDRRNKETHEKKHFAEYIGTKIYGTALERDLDVSVELLPMDSHMSYGLMAVDYFSWSLFRKFEYQDDTFSRLFEEKLLRRREWYL